MNIFVLDTNPILAAQMQCDKHVVKMVLETAQILSTINGGPYKPTHHGHPCVKWAAANQTNFNWLCRHGVALCKEYSMRYARRHMCQNVIEQIAYGFSADDLPVGISEFVQCMPESLRGKDPVEAYRKYYHTKSFAVWNRGRPAPYWWEQDKCHKS